MNRPRIIKITAVISAVILLTAVLVPLLVKLLITPERVKAVVVPMAEKKLQRKVNLQEIEISLFSGIRLKNLQVLEKDGKETFVSAAESRLRYQLWPLISGRVIIDEITLINPQARIVRFPDGTFNYSDLLAAKERAAEPPKEAGKEIHLLISKASVENGKILFQDLKQPGAPAWNIGDVDVSARDISKEKPFPITAKAAIAGITASIAGKVGFSESKPSLDADLTIVAADLQKTVAALPAPLKAKAGQYAPSGGIRLNLKLAGPVSPPLDLPKGGSAKLDDIGLNASGVRTTIAGELGIKPDLSIVSKNLVVIAGGNRLNVALATGNLMKKPYVVNANVTGEKFDIDPFLQKKPAAPSPGGTAAKQERKPLNLPVRAAGSIRIASSAWKGLELKNLHLDYRLADNVLTVKDLGFGMAGGTITASSRINLAEPEMSHSSALALTGIRAEQLIPIFAPKAAGTTFGTLALKGNLTGRGTSSESLKRTLSGDGEFAITDGKLTGSGLVAGLATFINVDELRVLQFSRFSGSYQIRNGRVTIDSSADGKDVQMAPKGSVGFDKTVELSLPVRLSPRLSGRIARGDIGKFLSDEQGRTTIPLKVSGTVSAPSFRIDQAAAGQELKKKTREKIEQTIQEKLLKKKPGEAPPPGSDLLERGLRGILGQ